MSHVELVWAFLRRRPLHGLLGLLSATLVFALYGLGFGIAEALRYTPSTAPVAFAQQLQAVATAVSAGGIALILVLTASAMAQAVRLRANEVGLLKALGFSHRRIIALFMAEASAPCVAGAVLGLVAAPALFAALTALVPPLAQLPPPAYTITLIVVALAVSLLVPLLSSAIPARRLVRLEVYAAMTGRIDASHPVAVGDPEQRHRRAAAPERSPANDRPFTPGGQVHFFRQIAVVSRVGISTLPRRIKGALLIVGSVAVLSFVLLYVLSMAEGIRTSILEGGDPGRAVLRSKSTAWLQDGRLPDGLASVALDAPGVARAADGSALAEAVHHAVMGLAPRDGSRRRAVLLVGVGPHWQEMTPSFQLLSGRLPHPGSRELLAGYKARETFSDLDDDLVTFRGETWKVVGTFSTGNWWNGYMLGDYAEVRAHAASSADTAIFVKLQSPESFDRFRASILGRLPSSITVERETDFHAALWKSIPKSLVYIVFMLSFIIAIGVITGITHAVHAALEERRREIAILRIVGFDRRAVASSVVIESLLLALLGSFIGSALVWLAVDGAYHHGAWSAWQSTVNGHLLLVAMAWASTVAMVGTVPMAVRTLRKSEREALADLRVPADAVQANPSRRSWAGAMPRALRPAAALAVAAICGPLRGADGQPPPEATEQWAPVPPVVTTRPGAAPSDAIGLFIGKNLDSWTRPTNRPGTNPAPARSWKVVDDAMVIEPGAGDLQTKASFGDVQLHLEFRTPSVTKGDGQDRGNSGIFFMGRYELQVLDSYNNATYVNGQAASVYKQSAPLVNASRPPGEWQTLDVIFCAPRFGATVTPARMTVLHNGVLVQNDVSLLGPTVYRGKPVYQPHEARLPLTLQDHGSPVAFRNIWVRELACRSNSGQGASPESG